MHAFLGNSEFCSALYSVSPLVPAFPPPASPLWTLPLRAVRRRRTLPQRKRGVARESVNQAPQREVRVSRVLPSLWVGGARPGGGAGPVPPAGAAAAVAAAAGEARAMSLRRPGEEEGGSSRLRGLEEPLPPPPLLPWDRFSAWLHCVCVVGFDLELGQAVEVGEGGGWLPWQPLEGGGGWSWLPWQPLVGGGGGGPGLRPQWWAATPSLGIHPWRLE